MPINPGETLADYETRLKADFERRQGSQKTVDQMSEAERREGLALAMLSRPAPRTVVAPFEGQHIRDLSPHQRAEAARQLGIGHLFPQFR